MPIPKDYLQEDTTGYGSHIPVLKFIFDTVDIHYAIELGTGFFSTSFLLDHVKSHLFSIEMQNKEWYNLVVERYEGNVEIMWDHYFNDSLDAYLFNIGGPNLKHQFVLVDGSAVTRAIAVVASMDYGVPIIVLHDTESSWYGYSTIDEYLSKYGYYMHEFKDIAPYTKIFTTDEKLIAAFKNIKTTISYESR